MTALALVRAHLRERIARLEPPQRIPGVDLARALAVIGMFAAHLLDQDDLVWTEPETWAGIVDGRSSILFATLAGVSLALTAGRRPGDTRADRFRTDLRTAARALLIWMLGWLLLLLMVPVHVILHAYAVLFLIAIVLLRLSTLLLVLTAAVTAVLGPVLVQWISTVEHVDEEVAESLFVSLGWNYPFLAWTAFIAAGIVIGRSLHHLTARRAALITGAGVLLAIIGYGLIGPIGNRAIGGDTGPEQVWSLTVLQDRPHSTGIGEMIGSGGFAIAVIGVCVLIGQTGLRWPAWPLRALGSMPLTAYTAHLMIWGSWLIAEEARLGIVITERGEAFRALDPFWPMTIGILIACSLWALVIGRGPVEALLARLVSLIAGSPAKAGRAVSKESAEVPDRPAR